MFIAVGVFPVELLAYYVCKLTKIALFIYLMLNWVHHLHIYSAPSCDHFGKNRQLATYRCKEKLT